MMQPNNLRNSDDSFGADPIQGHRAAELPYHVRSPVVALAGLAEERAGWVESAQVAQLLAKHSLPETGTSILVIMMSP